MKKEEFIALGIREELAEKAAKASKKELERFIPKVRFDEINEARKKLKEDVKARQFHDIHILMETGKIVTEMLENEIEKLLRGILP